MKSLSEGIAAGAASVVPAHKALELRARHLMTTGVATLRCGQTFAQAIDVLTKGHLSGVPVLDSAGNVVGVVSEFDCIRAIVETSFHQDGAPGGRLVEHLMSREVLSVTPETDLFTIAHVLIRHRIRRVLVIDDGKLVGMVSRRDLLLAIRDALE